MNKGFMGIDLGTSSVKIIVKYENGETHKSRVAYDEISPEGWFNAIVKAVSELDVKACAAIGLSSQVGTYIINGKDVISWKDACGSEEVKEIKSAFSEDIFIKEISMPHPDIISYPIPRLKYIEKKYGSGAKVCQPKDMIINWLTGNLVSDKYSWRGLCNIQSGKYSEKFLKEIGNPVLPKLYDYTECAGLISDEIANLTGIPEATPVYTGLNDFYASIAGMGITSVGEMFDITGTSEHLGIITDKLFSDTHLVSSPYIQNFVHYGVTASSGASAKYAISCFDAEDILPDKSLIENSPIFLPYLNGERAPIFDADARGMFFGINGKCTKKHMAYSVFEGVVFSLYHIYEHLGVSEIDKITVSGGAAGIPILNTLKSELFAVPIHTLCEDDTSALGAAMVAAVGYGKYKDIEDVARKLCKTKDVVTPCGQFRELMLKRFEIYKQLYPHTKELNKSLKEVQP